MFPMCCASKIRCPFQHRAICRRPGSGHLKSGHPSSKTVLGRAQTPASHSHFRLHIPLVCPRLMHYRLWAVSSFISLHHLLPDGILRRCLNLISDVFTDLGRILLMSESDPVCQVLHFPVDGGAAWPTLTGGLGTAHCSPLGHRPHRFHCLLPVHPQEPLSPT